MNLEDLAVIGNCQISALVAKTGAIVWCCLPRFDSEPVFGSLLDHKDGGELRVAPAGGEVGELRYIENTNVAETTFTTDGGVFRVIDFAPRFHLYHRSFRPTRIVRIIEPVSGTPRVRVTCDPRLGWSREAAPVMLGSNHLNYKGYESPLRLTTDVPLSYVNGEPFTLTERRHLILAWGEPVEEPLRPLCDQMLGQTVRYWQAWVKHCNIPPLYQSAVIRSALTLKLHCFEDTGAIVAAMTTSVPESPDSTRNWDYRYCWLRDAYYALEAFRQIGHFEEREGFTRYLLDVLGGRPEVPPAPLYRIDGKSDLDERLLHDWPGFEGHGPVRVGNGAAAHTQNDIYGEMVLALAPMYLDERLGAERSESAYELLERLTRKAIAVAGTPDAGIWEYRTAWQPQTFSGMMCWAAADRMAIIAGRHVPEREHEFRHAADRIHQSLLDQAWNPTLGSFAATYGGNDLDASILQMARLRFLPRTDPRLVSTVDAIERGLDVEGWLQRYKLDDGFEQHKVAFVICTFWLIEALAAIGEHGRAREVMGRVYGTLSPLGLIAEDYDPATRRMWGNFPQAYSHVGLINAAFATSPSWSDVL